MLSRRLLRIKALKALYSHLKSESDSIMTSQKSMMASIDKAYDLYFQMLTLPYELVRYAESRHELARQKMLPTHEDLNPNTKFVDNSVIRLLADSDSINDHVSKAKLTWSQHPELIKSLYTQISQRDYFVEYMNNAERSFGEDKALLERIYCDELQECELLDEALEDMSIMWVDDLSFVLVMVMRTLQNLKPSHTDIKVLPKFKNDDDKDFVLTLFAKSLVKYDEYMRYIDKFTHNWDVERIAYMDHLIMVLALVELQEFESIPVKVTLDEFIEISKYYSTPGSSTFVNGILDKMVVMLTEEGKIKKAGRGLINKSLK